MMPRISIVGARCPSSPVKRMLDAFRLVGGSDVLVVNRLAEDERKSLSSIRTASETDRQHFSYYCNTIRFLLYSEDKCKLANT